MENVKLNFLNWRPDAEDYENDGLITADNFLHDKEGYKQLLQQTSAAFSTTSPLNAGLNTISSIKAKTFGNNNQVALADIYAPDTTTAALRIGVHGNNAFTTTTLATLASVGGARITSFSIGELNQSFVISATAEASLLAGGVTTYALSGTVAYTITSV